MSQKKFESLEEIQELRKDLSDEYKGGLPDYLVDYFDEEERKKLNSEFYIKKAISRRNKTFQEKIDSQKFMIEKFWNENKSRIRKVQRRVEEERHAGFPEPERNIERASQEKELTPEETAILVSLCSKDIELFAIRYFGHYLKKPNSQVHRYIYKYLNRQFGKTNRKEGFKKAIAAPRGSAKSSIISIILPIWCICYNKKKFVILVSDTASQAEDFLSDIRRELELNSLLLRDFTHVCGKGPKWKNNELITNNGVKILALGTGNKIRGRRFGTDRPDLLIGDDLENSEMVNSETMRDFTRNNWFNKDFLYVGGEEGTITDFFIVGTILGSSSLLNNLLDVEEYPDWESKRFSSVLRFSQEDDLWDEWAKIYKNSLNSNRKKDAFLFFKEHEEEMLKGTQVIWPEGEPYYKLMVHKLSDPSGFSSEKQNSPLDPTKILVPLDSLKFINFQSNSEIIRILTDKSNKWFGALDPSLGKKATSGDYSAIITIVRDNKTGNILVVDMSLKRRSVDDQIEAILRAHEKFHYNLFGIETNLFQLVIAENLRKKSKKEGLYVPLKEINQSVDKKGRIEAIVPLIMDGTLIFDKHLYMKNQQYRLGIEQLTQYTGDGSGNTHDDAPDALAMAISLATTPVFKRRYALNR